MFEEHLEWGGGGGKEGERGEGGGERERGVTIEEEEREGGRELIYTCNRGS